jgi:hypothetical protein
VVWDLCGRRARHRPDGKRSARPKGKRPARSKGRPAGGAAAQ